jgi:hypothetical protein
MKQFDENYDRIFGKKQPEGKQPGKREFKMNIGHAVDALRDGYKVSRRSWNGKNMFLYYVRVSFLKVSCVPLIANDGGDNIARYGDHVCLRCADGSLIPWVCSQSDLLGDDWFIFGEENDKK